MDPIYNFLFTFYLTTEIWNILLMAQIYCPSVLTKLCFYTCFCYCNILHDQRTCTVPSLTLIEFPLCCCLLSVYVEIMNLTYILNLPLCCLLSVYIEIMNLT